MEHVVGHAGRVDVPVNNAGYGQYGALEEVEPEVARRQFEVNVFGMMRLTQKLPPVMRRQGSGRIVNISSVAGRISTPFAGWYAASKHAVEALSDALRVEVEPFGIRVVLIEPGANKTGFDGVAMEELGDNARLDVYRVADEAFAGIVSSSYEGAPGPEVVAEAVHRAVAAGKPRARYALPADSRLLFLARRLLGDSQLDWLFSRQLGDRSARKTMPSREPAVRR